MKICRNSPCICGSGKKYKNCCLLKSSPVNLPLRISWVDSPKHLGDLKRIPSSLNISINQDKKLVNCSKLKEIFFKCNYDLNKEETRLFFNDFIDLSSSTCSPFAPEILDKDIFLSIIKENIPIARLIYFNEINQYIYWYQVKTFSFYSESLNRVLNYFDDHITLAFLIRQIIELLVYFTTNLWAIFNVYNLFQKNMEELILSKIKRAEIGFITFSDLEEFVLSLNYWPPKGLDKLKAITGKDISYLEQDDYNIQDYQPSTYLQFEILKFLSKLSTKTKSLDFAFGKELVEMADYYKFMCKFVHPNPHMLPHTTSELSSDVIKYGIQKGSLDALVNCISLSKKFIFGPKAYNARFDKLLLSLLPLSCSGNPIMINIAPSEILNGIKRNYKGLTIQTASGPLEIVKGENISKRSNMLARIFDSLDEDAKLNVENYIKKQSMPSNNL